MTTTVAEGRIPGGNTPRFSDEIIAVLGAWSAAEELVVLATGGMPGPASPSRLALFDAILCHAGLARSEITKLAGDHTDIAAFVVLSFCSFDERLLVGLEAAARLEPLLQHGHHEALCGFFASWLADRRPLVAEWRALPVVADVVQ